MPRPQPYLVLEIGPKGFEDARTRLEGALHAGPIASVLVAAVEGSAFEPRTAKSLIDIIQAKEAAALLADEPNLARTLRADGVHLRWSKAPLDRFAEAREILGERFIIGADAGRSRHEAMELGEAGASYVAFGIPAHVEDRAKALERQVELVRWWSEIFEIPSVALDAADATAAARLAEAGADFVGITLEDGLAAEDAAQKVADFCRAMQSAEAEV